FRSYIIVDVFMPVSNYDPILKNTLIYYSVAETSESEDDLQYYAMEIDVVLREGSSESQLLQEINDRLKPLGLVAEMSKAIDNYDINMIIGIRLLTYLIGSLILLAAIIGFLRIQIQLFWIRRREISLRVVNGATRANLLGLLLTETSITIILSMIFALWFGGIVEQFINKRLGFIEDVVISNLWSYTLVIGCGLIAICCIMAWVTLVRICKSTQSLAANMRRSRNHFFRNMMLGVQTTISLIFVCVTLIGTTAGNKILDFLNLPDNDDFYKECLHLRLEYASEQERLLDEIERLPDLDKMVMFDGSYHNIMEISQNPDVMDKLHNQTHYNIYQTLDTTTLSLLGIEVEWFNSDIDRNRCMLLRKELYNQFLELGILENNTLSFTPRGNKSTIVLPIAGIIKNIPYDTRKDVIVAICRDRERIGADYILAPKPGAGNRLALSVNETIQRLEPSLINSPVSNYRGKVAATAVLTESFRTGGWILGIVSLIICAMGIYSTITLDTRARVKEVAIRKVNGAKSKDIYLIFGKVYITIMAFAVVISVPVLSILYTMIDNLLDGAPEKLSFSPIGPIILGFLVVTMLITLIVGWQTHRVLQVDPAKIIAKE
ncbi:MAG: ABC transporter permease, partial [Muribaculaceae bacterium]|nr:ABC transporter permease [Muribaculaceae bacterium]